MADSSTVAQSSRPRGTRSRAGNAMGRTRDAALEGAVQAVAKYGSRKATMGDIAMLAGIAKATLYNHFRTRDDVYAAAVLAEVDRLAATAAAAGAAVEPVDAGADAGKHAAAAAALAAAARLVGEHPAVRRIAQDAPATLAAMAAPGDSAAWRRAREHIAGWLCAAGLNDTPGAVDLIARYLASQLLATASAAETAACARLLVTALGAGQAGSADTSS